MCTVQLEERRKKRGEIRVCNTRVQHNLYQLWMCYNDVYGVQIELFM